MSQNITSDILSGLGPQSKRGRPPIVRHCPYCHVALNVTEMRRHRPACARDYKRAQPQPKVVPTDLENQELSSDPLERLRQIEQQEADRIERS